MRHVRYITVVSDVSLVYVIVRTHLACSKCFNARATRMALEGTSCAHYLVCASLTVFYNGRDCFLHTQLYRPSEGSIHYQVIFGAMELCYGSPLPVASRHTLG